MIFKQYDSYAYHVITPEIKSTGILIRNLMPIHSDKKGLLRIFKEEDFQNTYTFIFPELGYKEYIFESYSSDNAKNHVRNLLIEKFQKLLQAI